MPLRGFRPSNGGGDGGGAGWQSPGVDIGPVAEGADFDGVIVVEAGPSARTISKIWFSPIDYVIADDTDAMGFTFTVYTADGMNGDEQIITTQTEAEGGTGDWPVYGRVAVNSDLIIPAGGRLVVIGNNIGAGIALPKTRVGVDFA